MVAIARWTMAHRRIVVLGWVVAAFGVLVLAGSVGKKTASSFTLPGTGSQQAADLLQSRFASQAGDADQVVFHTRSGTLANASQRAAIESMLARVSRLPHVTAVISPYAAGQHSISRDGTIGFATVSFDQRANALSKSTVNRVIHTADAARSSSLEVELGGQAIEQAQQASLGFATVVGILAAVLILLVSFGSFSAMGLPISTALLGLGAGVGVITLASHIVDMPDFASELALMIGLGVGIDYALFIVTRFRQNFAENGGDVAAAVEAAMNTSGRAVVFAGATVVIALLGMFALGVSLLNGAAVAASIGVVLVLAASITLLPALLATVGQRIGASGGGGRSRATARGSRAPFWRRWVVQVQRRPALTAVLATALLLALAAPALGLRLAASDAGNDRSGQTTRKAYDLLAKGFGPGFNGPLQLAVALPRAHDAAAFSQLAGEVRATPGVASVSPPRLSPSETAAVLVVYPDAAPQSASTSGLVTRLRDRVIPASERRSGARVFVGGATAAQIDFSHVLSTKLPLFIAVVIGLAALLLLVVFRSLVIPIQAALMNLLSIAASLGIVQAVFERGWFAGLFGTQAGPIDAFIPVLAFAIVFGLSMDYEVFLVSRIHEEWQLRRDASGAIREGLAHTGRVITAAAAVMVAVFGAFAISGNRVLSMFGLAMASAVFLDALVVRMLLLPAVLQLVGRTTWTLPAWLEARLPRLELEADPREEVRPRPSPQPALEPGA
jgi:RND superfamily putative drug exporter